MTFAFTRAKIGANKPFSHLAIQNQAKKSHGQCRGFYGTPYRIRLILRELLINSSSRVGGDPATAWIPAHAG